MKAKGNAVMQSLKGKSETRRKRRRTGMNAISLNSVRHAAGNHFLIVFNKDIPNTSPLGK